MPSSLEGYISLPLVSSMLILVVLEMLILALLLLLLLFILIPDLLLQDNTIHTGLEQSAYSRGLALKETKTIEWHGGGGASEVGEFIGELCTGIGQ